MDPLTEYRLGQQRLEELRREAAARRGGRPHGHRRIRRAVGEALIRAGLRLSGDAGGLRLPR